MRGCDGSGCEVRDVRFGLSKRQDIRHFENAGYLGFSPGTRLKEAEDEGVAEGGIRVTQAVSDRPDGQAPVQ
jgi:hypothetical protein